MIKKMKISQQLSVLVGVFVVALLSVGILGLSEKNVTLESLRTVYEDRVVPLKQLSTIVDAYAVNIVDTAHKVSNSNIGWQEGGRNLAEAREIISRELEAYLGTVLVAEEEQLVEKLAPLIAQADVTENRLRDIFQRQDQAALENLIDNELYQNIDPLSEVFEQLMTVQLDVAEREYNRGMEQYSDMRIIFISIMAVVILIGILLAWYIISGISRRLGAEPMRVAEIARQVADKRLDIDIETRSDKDDGSVLFAMRRMVDNLSSVIVSVRDSSSSIHVGIREIASGNADLSSRTEEQAAALGQTASSMEELTATVKQNADNAKQASGLAKKASTTAERGGEVVDQVVVTMHGIANSSQQIADITGVIDSIAFQTNILALNASVEAARAGEQGRGFAVVASEVRNLASRSADAARQIKSLIEGSVAQVHQGSTLVEQAGKTMGEVVTEVRRVTDIMDEISAASQEQSDGIEQVAQAVGQMDEVTQQNAALVQQAAAASASLEEQADRLEEAVAVFKLSSQHHAGQLLASPNRVSRPASPTKPALHEQTSSRAALQHPQRKTADKEEWESF
ncbi:methyl-accepting chemotaxis protein [Halomonas sp.]|uniref:methyl-accepting chemotaxis protein n=1 Tax=Halomonas sp. TaxID=1486246 RepID=UPI00384DCCC5